MYTCLPAKQALLLKTNVHAVGPQLYGVRFKVVAFAGGVAAVGQAKLVAVQGAYNVAGGIHKTVGHNTPGMRAFVGAGKQTGRGVGKGKLFTVGLRNQQVIPAKI